jgi:hypothetical protein
MVDYVTQRGHSVTFGNYGWFYTYGNPREVTNEEVKEVWEMWFRHWREAA